MIFRRIEERDLEDLFNFRNDPRIYKWCRQNAPLHWDNHVSWFKRQSSDQSQSFFVLSDRKNVIGVVGLTDIDLVNSRAEFSCYINSEDQGKKYGQLAIKEILRYGFETLGLYKIWGETFEGNPALQLFKKLGMQEEGTRKGHYYRDGCYIDCHLVFINSTMYHRLYSYSKKAKNRAKA